MTLASTAGPPGSQLLLRRFADSGPPVLMVHGLGESGDIFCPAPDSGLAPWLADAGYSVHVADLRMRSAHEAEAGISQHQLITEDLPILFERIVAEHPGTPFFILAHGWGGVLVSSALIRQPWWQSQVAGLIQIGVRRVCQQHSWRRRLLLDLMWGRAAPWLGRRQGVSALRTLGLREWIFANSYMTKCECGKMAEYGATHRMVSIMLQQ